MPIYCYEHPISKKIYEVLRSFSESNKDYIAEDGVKCVKIIKLSVYNTTT